MKEPERGEAHSSAPLPDSNTPLAQAVPRLEAAASEGNAAAAIELARRLRSCTPKALKSLDVSDDYDADVIEGHYPTVNLDTAQIATNSRRARARIARRASVREACLAVPESSRAHWLDALDRAARAGNVDAMLEYTHFAIQDYQSRQDVLADVDTAIERRDKARAYLMEAMRLGDRLSLSELAYQYAEQGGGALLLFDADPYEEYVYAYAGSLAGASVDRDLEYLMDQSAKSLDPDRVTAARDEGMRIYQSCCAK